MKSPWVSAGVVAAACLLVAAAPAGACDVCGSGEVSDDGVLARARSQMNELNAGYPGGPPAPNCDDEHTLVPEDGNDEVEYEGYLRWVPDFENDPTPPDDGPSIEWYRQECYIPGLPPRDGDPPGASWRRFDAATPENIARVAIDEALAAIPDHRIATSPEVESLVAVETWFWVEQAGGGPPEPVTATAQLQNVTITATARPGGVHYDFGDDTSLDCEGGGTPWVEGAESDCTHEYQTAGVYPVTATIQWTGSYTVGGGAPVPIDATVDRVATFDLTVNEAQAINTRTGG